jgi:hypothetical protein
MTVPGMEMSGQDPQGVPTACENCGTPLQGHYCHACGQSVHSPTRHFRHALEDVFESFWHLDGRVFRTLRDLLFPGRIARNYLQGQRVRYIAPLRLFVILCLLTFFVGKLTVRIDEEGFKFEGREAVFATAQTIPEVVQARDKLLAELSRAEKEAAKVPGVNASLVAARARIQSEAANRIAELRKASEAKTGTPAATPPAAADAGTAATAPDAKDGNTPATPPDAKRAATAPAPSAGAPDTAPAGKDEWDPKANPVDVAWLPAFADRWINQRMARAKDNLSHMQGNANRYVQAFLGAVPTALFVLMPVFALLLKLLYLGSGRRYLEHLVVALYSQAWLLLVLLLTFLVSLASQAIGALWATTLSAVVISTLWLLGVPVYLFITQLRVYGEHWALTAVRYCVVGTVYFFLVVAATVFAALAGISS